MRHFKTVIPFLAVVSFCGYHPVTTAATADVTQESPRERNRVLLKRNPIASEYQEKGRLGLAPGGAADAEGVDFRSLFRLSSLGDNQQRVSFDLSGSYQESSGDVEPGGVVSLGKSGESFGVQVRLSSSAASRKVDHYESRWLVDRPVNGGGTVDIPGFLRFSQDHYDTTNLGANWRVDWKVTDTFALRYEGLATDYDDEAYRNRLEYQAGSGDLENVSSLSANAAAAEFDAQDARIRRYFHIMDTSRDITRHLLQANWQTDLDTFELSLYDSNWQNARDWSPWNFFDSGVDLSVSLSDRYVPLVTATNDVDVLATDASNFSNFRPSLLTTTDNDQALRLDWDRASDGRYMTAGLLWRKKERVAEHSRDVYFGSTEALTLSELLGNNRAERIIEGDFLLPAGLDVELAESAVISRPGAFALNDLRSFLETLQDEFTSSEEVTSVYGSWDQTNGFWRWQLALRYEMTDIDTIGAVSGPPSALTGIEGERVLEIVAFDRVIQETFADVDAYRVPGSAEYDHWIPTLAVRYEPSDSLSVRAALYRSLMRPQYFDVVRYRRINPPTQSINEGNPGLEATVIDSLSLGAEWTTSSAGKLAAEIYYKDIADFFFDTRTTELLDGLNYEVRRVENGGSGYIYGFQFQWEKGFADRVDWLNKLDVSLAYTWSESEGDIGSRKIDIPERSRHLLQSALSVGWGQWQYRMDLAWQSEALDRVGDNAITDQYREEVVTFNHSLSRSFGERWQARLRVINILNYPERSFEGESLRVINNQYSDMSVQGSLSLRL